MHLYILAHALHIIQSMNSKSNKDYPRAKKYGKYAFLLTVCDVFFTLCIALLITGPVVGWNALSY